jgi:hypothetical protein
MNQFLSALTLTCAAQIAGAQTAAHARTEFRFTLDVPYDRAAPLFGAHAEQKWAPDWKPRFIYPDPAEDRQGAIFFVEAAGHSALWTTTEFDLPRGRVQYVSLWNQHVLTRIDITLAHNGPLKTDVRVAYERTAVDPSANEHVKAMSAADANKGPEWKRQIEACAAIRNKR